MTLPMVVPDPSLPGRVTIWEVGPRDGLQNESCVIDTQTKILRSDALRGASNPQVDKIEKLLDCSLKTNTLHFFQYKLSNRENNL